MVERTGSSILQLPRILVEQPVVDVVYLAKRLDITPRAAYNLVDRACSYGILTPIGNARREDFYQTSELIEVLEAISDVHTIRRVLARRPGIIPLRVPVFKQRSTPLTPRVSPRHPFWQGIPAFVRAPSRPWQAVLVAVRATGPNGPQSPGLLVQTSGQSATTGSLFCN